MSQSASFDRDEVLQNIASKPLEYIAVEISALRQTIEYAEDVVTMGKAILEIPSMAEQTEQQKEDDIKLRKQMTNYGEQIAQNRVFLRQLMKIFRGKYISSHAPPADEGWPKILDNYAKKYLARQNIDVFWDDETVKKRH